jgi:putative addiction module killer protein
MVEVVESATYKAWFAGLRDRRARARIDARIRRLSLGNPGDAEPVGEGVSELRVDYGPGYRVYFLRHGPELVVLLAGGDKRGQAGDIKRAKQIAAQWRRGQGHD